MAIAPAGALAGAALISSPLAHGETGREGANYKAYSSLFRKALQRLLFRDPGHPATHEESLGFQKLLSHQRNEKPSEEPRALAGRCVRACGHRAEDRCHRQAPGLLVLTGVLRGVPQPPPLLLLLPDGARKINKPLSSPSNGPPTTYWRRLSHSK